MNNDNLPPGVSTSDIPGNNDKDICGCADKNCPVHKGFDYCENEATLVLNRVDMLDNLGTIFCEDCAKDAMESGLFVIL